MLFVYLSVKTWCAFFFFFRFFGSNLRVLPVRNCVEIVKGMLTIAKVKTVSASDFS